MSVDKIEAARAHRIKMLDAGQARGTRRQALSQEIRQLTHASLATAVRAPEHGRIGHFVLIGVAVSDVLANLPLFKDRK